jgi:hypothetical protein
MDAVTNVLRNAVAPVDITQGSAQVLGTAEFVAVEVLVSKMVRSMLKMENRSVWDLFWIHLLSVPFLGGIGAPFGDIRALRDLQPQEGYTKAVKDGLKGVPAVLAAQWVFNTASKGFHVPWFTIKDILIIAGSKAITRPLVYSVIAKLPPTVAEAYAVVDVLVQRQSIGSNLRNKA